MKNKNSGTTLLELLVGLSITALIIVVLYQMFNITRNHLHNASEYNDKYESIRNVTDILRSDISQMSPVTTYVGTNWSYNTFITSNSYTPITTNQFQDFVFLVNSLQSSPTNWVVVGYRIANRTNANYWTTDGVGTLYRWTTNTSRLNSNVMTGFISNLIPTNNLYPILDNVIHFKVDQNSTNGKPSLVFVEIIITDKGMVERSRHLSSPKTYLSTNINGFYISKTIISVLSREK